MNIEALQHHVPFLSASQQSAFEDKVGMLPMFPIPDLNHSSSTLLGGWQLGIPNSSRNKDLAWELITIMMEPNIITPMLKKYGYLPTRVSIGEGVNSPSGDFTIPYYKEIVSMIEIGNTRPHIPEFPQIADHIREALDDVYYGYKEPQQALDDAAANSAKSLGW